MLQVCIRGRQFIFYYMEFNFALWDCKLCTATMTSKKIALYYEEIWAYNYQY